MVLKVFNTVSNSIDIKFRGIDTFDTSYLAAFSPKVNLLFHSLIYCIILKKANVWGPYLLAWWRQRYASTKFFVGNLILYNFRLKQFLIVTKVSIPVSILLIFYLKVSIRIDTKFFRYFNTTNKTCFL